MAHSQSLEKTFDGVKDMETSHNKKRTSSNVCLSIVEKTKIRATHQKKKPSSMTWIKSYEHLECKQRIWGGSS